MALFDKKPTEKNHMGSVDPDSTPHVSDKMIGFVLLRHAEWDKARFFEDMKSRWGIELSDDHPEENDVVYVTADGFLIIIGLMPAAIPNGEAEYYAKANYMWKEAERVVARHGAHLLVTVMGAGDMLDRARLYVKVTAALLGQEQALALYSEGAVYQPEMFCDCAGAIEDGSLPILNLVWFGLYGDGKKSGVYTYGLRRFGKEEIEVYVPSDKADLNYIRNFLVSVTAYILEEDVVLKDGETIGFSADEKLPIKESPGLAVKGNTIKIDILKHE